MSNSTAGLQGQRRSTFNVDSILIVQMEEGAQAEAGNTPKAVDREESSSFSDLSRLSQKDRLVELVKMSYRDFQIGIFTDSLETPPRRFFFEPVVFLDPRKIFSESHGLYKEDVVRFTVLNVDPDIRLKVLGRLRSLPMLAKQSIQLYDVQLAHIPECIKKPMHLVNPPLPYRKMNKSLDFHLLCDSPSYLFDKSAGRSIPPQPRISFEEVHLVYCVDWLLETIRRLRSSLRSFDSRSSR